MEKITEKKRSGGRVEIFQDLKRKFFLARPHGIINPSLLREDLDRARHFSNEVQGGWSYVTDTSDVKLVNPLNLFYLKEVKKIKHLKQIVVYAPNPLNQMLLRLASWIVKPDRIITEPREFAAFIGKVK
jgi:hypothetical protein